MKLLLKLTVCCLLIMAYSCSEPSLVGEELLEEAIPFNAFTTDTVTVKLSTVKEDKLKTDSLGFYLIGNIEDDPEFGNTRASVFTQVRLPSNNIDLVSSTSELPIYDSLVLRLNYNFHYGDSTAAQTIQVFELTEDLDDINKTYYQNQSGEYNPTPLAVLDNYKHQFSDSITLARPTAFNLEADTFIVEKIETPTHLRIKLSDELGKRFFEQSGQTAFTDNDEFLNFFKGFHIAVDGNTSDKSLMVSYALENSSVSSLLLYYHTEGQDYIYSDTLKTDSSLVTTYNHQTLGFPINYNGNTFNQIINDYSGSNAIKALNSSADDEGDELAYIQAGGGLHIKVEFPHIRNGEFDKVLINKATLNLFQVPTANSILFTPPALIGMYDAELYKEGFYSNVDPEAGSFLNTDTATQKMQYNFIFSALLQNIIEGENSEEIILVPVNIVPVDNSFTTNRAVIGGLTGDDLEATLELIYTKTE